MLNTFIKPTRAAIDRPHNMNVKDLLEVCKRGLDEALVSQYARVVDQYIHATPALVSQTDQRLDLIALGHVSAVGDCLPP
jgi:hypothetical protein